MKFFEKILARIKGFGEKEWVKIAISLVPWILFNTWLFGSMALIGIALIGSWFSYPFHLFYGSQVAFGIGFMSLMAGSIVITLGLAIRAMVCSVFEKPAHH